MRNESRQPSQEVMERPAAVPVLTSSRMWPLETSRTCTWIYRCYIYSIISIYDMYYMLTANRPAAICCLLAAADRQHRPPNRGTERPRSSYQWRTLTTTTIKGARRHRRRGRRGAGRGETPTGTRSTECRPRTSRTPCRGSREQPRPRLHRHRAAAGGHH